MNSSFFKVALQRLTNCFKIMVKMNSFIRKLICIENLWDSALLVTWLKLKILSGVERATVFTIIISSGLKAMGNIAFIT